MNDRDRAKEIVTAVFEQDLKGEIGRLARFAVPSEDKRAIVDRVERAIGELRAEAQSIEHAVHETA